MLHDEECIKKFWSLYTTIFDSNGGIKLCGREACKKMIAICEQIDQNNVTGKYGDLKTGYLNVKSIKALAFDLTEQ